jgi:hypothetical protein
MLFFQLDACWHGTTRRNSVGKSSEGLHITAHKFVQSIRLNFLCLLLGPPHPLVDSSLRCVASCRMSSVHATVRVAGLSRARCACRRPRTATSQPISCVDLDHCSHCTHSTPHATVRLHTHAACTRCVSVTWRVHRIATRPRRSVDPLRAAVTRARISARRHDRHEQPMYAR